jgi:hypothetical protein
MSYYLNREYAAELTSSFRKLVKEAKITAEEIKKYESDVNLSYNESLWSSQIEGISLGWSKLNNFLKSDLFLKGECLIGTVRERAVDGSLNRTLHVNYRDPLQHKELPVDLTHLCNRFNEVIKDIVAFVSTNVTLQQNVLLPKEGEKIITDLKETVSILKMLVVLPIHDALYPLIIHILSHSNSVKCRASTWIVFTFYHLN